MCRLVAALAFTASQIAVLVLLLLEEPRGFHTARVVLAALGALCGAGLATGLWRARKRAITTERSRNDN